MNKLRDHLEYYAEKYNRKEFIEDDPISIPHRFSKIQDIEISAFWTAILAWGNRKAIIKSAGKLMELMDDSPYDFVMHHSESERSRFEHFVHRTFSYEDAIYFLSFLQHFYSQNRSLESAFSNFNVGSETVVEESLNNFYNKFFSLNYISERTRKHISRPSSKSRCKRLVMFLRWMVRSDSNGVDFGIWKNYSPSQLMIPLDVHVERSARKLNLLQRKQLDWKAVEELTMACRLLRPKDPAYYDYALFGLSLENKN
ncbi:MAG: TIGR02757 family protein [Saprospiraceae bacterium]